MSLSVAGVRSQRNKTVPVAGLWDFDGSCKPSVDGLLRFAPGARFSLGAFQWEARRTGRKGTVKRGIVVRRFSGHPSNYEEVCALAEKFCQAKEYASR